MIVFTRHQLHSRRRAQWLRVRVRKTNALQRHLVEMWRLIGNAAITTEPLDAHIIRHNQDNVGFLTGIASRTDNQREQNKQTETVHNGSLKLQENRIKVAGTLRVPSAK
jgi:hypothetical protein